MILKNDKNAYEKSTKSFPITYSYHPTTTTADPIANISTNGTIKVLSLGKTDNPRVSPSSS